MADACTRLTFQVHHEKALHVDVQQCHRNGVNTGGSLWGSSRHLAAWVVARRWLVSGARVVELACGLGVPSIVSAELGANVLATDEVAPLLAHLQQNASRNGCAVCVKTLDFTQRVRCKP